MDDDFFFSRTCQFYKKKKYLKYYKNHINYLNILKIYFVIEKFKQTLNIISWIKNWNKVKILYKTIKVIKVKKNNQHSIILVIP